MKIRTKIISFILFTTFISCKKADAPIVGFNEPQPIDIGNLSKIPNRLLGKYLNIKDSSLLVINENVIKRVNNFSDKIHIKELDSLNVLSGNVVINLKTKKRTQVRRIGDSLVFYQNYTDTIFRLSKINVLKKYKGYYFLNSLFEEKNWETKKVKLSKVKLSKVKLTISTINSIEEIQNLEKITTSSHDTISQVFKFKPTKRQFKKFVKEEGFGEEDETYIKLE
jgi:hypothetical protein